jgi:hypothetical protein
VTFGELLASIIERLDRARIPYMITGSLADDTWRRLRDASRWETV